MLPSLGFQEILLLGVLALVVVGPKDLPLMLRKLGRWTAKLRGMAQEFRTGFDELARQAELDELKKEVDALRRNNVLNDLQNEISRPIALPPVEAPPAPPPPSSASVVEADDEAPPALASAPLPADADITPAAEPAPRAAGSAS